MREDPRNAALTLAIALPLALAAAPSAAGDLDARALIEQAVQKNRPPSEVAAMTMTIRNARDQERVYRMRLWYRSADEGRDSGMLVRFVSPAEVRRFGLLVLTGQGGDGQWIYMPRADRVQRITGGDRTSSFVGSDFTYEDLEPMAIDDHAVERLADAERDGVACYVIQAVPKEHRAAESSYGRRVVFIDKERLFPVAIELYDRNDRLVKVQESTQLEDRDGVTVAGEVVMRDLRSRTQTTLRVERRALNVAIPDRIFTEHNLRHGD